MKGIRRLGTGLLLAAIAPTVLAPAPARAATPASLLLAIRDEAEWILDRQTGWQGSISSCCDTYHYKIVPYHGNLAAIGLARAYTLLREPRYASAAWRWLEWYQSHQLADGTISDWIYSSTWVPAGLPDSTDSYAGTFLSAALAAAQATGDLTRLRGIKPGIQGALDAIELTEDVDGLHFARPGWPFKYPMDEGEAYAGFRAAEELGRLLNDPAMTARAKDDADRLLAGSANLIDPATGLYLWALHADGTRVPAPLDWIYPGSSAQMWAVADGLAVGSAARTLVERVEARQPQWDRPGSNSQFADAQPNCNYQTPCIARTNYWVKFALAHLAIGNARRALTAALNIRNGATLLGRLFPFTPADAGMLIVVMGDPDVMAASVSPVGLPPTPA